MEYRSSLWVRCNKCSWSTTVSAPWTGPSRASWPAIGYASVTASMEAADDVLTVIARPAAVLLQAPTRRDPAYARRAARLDPVQALAKR